MQIPWFKPWLLVLTFSILLPFRLQAQPDIVANGSGFNVAATGKAFIPRGFNYIRLKSGHGTFNPQVYRASMVDSLIANLADNGFNAVRVFIDRNVHAGGIVETDSDTGLSAAYMGNMVDFLQRARKRNIYVMPTLELFPLGGKYRKAAMSQPMPANLEPDNYWYMHPGYIEAKKTFITDFLVGIRRRDPQALRAILAINIDNEAAFGVVKPFTLPTGSYTAPGGRTYDLSREKTALADDIAVYQVDAYCDAVQAVVPGLPVDISVFTYGAVKKSGPGDFRPQAEGWANRYPFRPTAMVASKADIIDIHLYLRDTAGVRKDLLTVEFPTLKTQAAAAGKALLVGEFGVFKNWNMQAAAVRSWMAIQPGYLLGSGFAGWLYWTYDTFEQPELINAAENRWEIFHILAEAKVPGGTRTARGPQLGFNKGPVSGGPIWNPEYPSLIFSADAGQGYDLSGKRLPSNLPYVGAAGEVNFPAPD